MTRKLVIEITEGDGRTNLLKRRDGIAKFIDNIDSFFKSDGKGRRAIKGVSMFFLDDGVPALPLPGAGPLPNGGVVLTEAQLQEEAGDGSDS